jgi:DNA-binding response OmpR family regulator
MKPTTLLLLTNDPEFEHTARNTAEASGCALVVGRKPEDAVRLFARHLTELRGAIVDLDIATHGAAWLGTLSALSPRIPAVAVSRLDPRFLQPLAQRYGADYWISKPVDSERLSLALQPLLPQTRQEERS